MAKETINGTPYLSKASDQTICENRATINISLNLVQHDRTKHVKVDTLHQKKIEDETI